MFDVTHSVEDGQLGLNNTSGIGRHLKIGASPVNANGPIILTGNRKPEYIIEKLGRSPLADAVMDSMENGADTILCLPVAASVAGTIGPVTGSSGDTTGTIMVEGSPYNAWDIVIKITGSGGLNTASFAYSINGGYSYSEDITVPAGGTYEVPDTGLTFRFVLEAEKKYEAGDSFTCRTTAPQMTNQDVITAVTAVKSIKTELEFVHIVGGCSVETWAAVAALQQCLAEENHKPLAFVLEAVEQSKDITGEEYIKQLEADRKRIRNYNIQVIASRIMYIGMDGVARNISAAALICGAYAQVAVNRSIGETAVISYSEDKVVSISPSADDAIDRLDVAGYLTIRQYDGLSGYYVTNARMLGPDGTDFRYMEDVRVANKIIRDTRREALLQLQSDIDLDKPEADLAAKAQFIKAPLDKMVAAQEISSVDVTIPADQNLLETETLQIQVRYVPRGKIRAIEVTIGMRNPYTA